MDRLSRRYMEILLGHARVELGRPELELKMKGMWAAKNAEQTCVGVLAMDGRPQNGSP